jgi:hypothetical protein
MHHGSNLSSPHQEAQRPLSLCLCFIHRGHQAPDGSTRSRAANLRPRLMTTGIRLPAARPEPPHERSSTPLLPVPHSKCEPTGTSALPGGHDRCITVRTFHPPIRRPNVRYPYACASSTADLRPRPGALGPGQQHAEPCCGPPTSPDAHRHQASGPPGPEPGIEPQVGSVL